MPARDDRLPGIARLLFALTAGVLALQLGLLFARSAYPGFAAMADRAVFVGGALWCGVAFFVCIAIWRLRATVWSERQWSAWRTSVWAAALIVAGKFFVFEVGKFRHNAEMENFFRASGYPYWLHYVVAALEIAGSAAILLPFRKGRMAASCMLLLIMSGAMLTHARNGDPLSDSCDAAFQAAYLLVLLVLCLVAPRKPA